MATRLTFARDWPTQLRGPSAKGMYLLGCLLSPVNTIDDEQHTRAGISVKQYGRQD